jgi:putative chitinase
MNLTSAQFAALFPKASVALLDPLNRAMVRFGIDSSVRTAMFLAQVGHESNGLTVFEENLNYSAQRLAAVWPKRYANADGGPNALALNHGRHPMAIANNTYAIRNGNGDEASGEGRRFRGRGAIQITGRNNYRAMAARLNLPLLDTPDLLSQPEGACASAACFWSVNGCNELADGGLFTEVTRTINGGTVGLEDRMARWNKAKAVLNG